MEAFLFYEVQDLPRRNLNTDGIRQGRRLKFYSNYVTSLASLVPGGTGWRFTHVMKNWCHETVNSRHLFKYHSKFEHECAVVSIALILWFNSQCLVAIHVHLLSERKEHAHSVVENRAVRPVDLPIEGPVGREPKMVAPRNDSDRWIRWFLCSYWWWDDSCQTHPGRNQTKVYRRVVSTNEQTLEFDVLHQL